MYISEPNLKTDLLQIDDHFATLSSITTSSDNNDQLHFEFYFSISQLKALQQNALSVLITVKKENQIVPSIVPSMKVGSMDTNQLINNILTHKAKLKNLSKDNEDLVLVKKFADITARINNQVLGYVNNSQLIESSGLTTTSIVVERKQEQGFVTKTQNQKQETIVGYKSVDTTDQINSGFENKKLSLKLLKNNFLSPASVTMLNDRTISPQENLTGILRKSRYEEYDYSNVSKLTNSYLFSKSNVDANIDSTFETYVNQSFNDIVNVKTLIDITSSQVAEVPTLIVTFELQQTIINRDGTKQVNILEKVDKKVNVQEHVKNFYFSNSFPIVESSYNDQEITFQIKSKGKVFNQNRGIKIFRKVLDDDFSKKYEQIDSVSLTSGFDLQVKKVKNLLGQNSIYRFVNFDEVTNMMNCDFSDIVTKNPRAKKTNKLVLIPSLTSDGIKINVYNHHMLDVVSVRLLIKNITIKQKSYSTVTLLTLDSNLSVNTVLIKNNLIPYHTYEISSNLIFENGTELKSSYSSFIQYVPYQGNIIENPINGLSVVGDVTFNLSTTLLKDQVSYLKTLLSQVSSEYSEEFLNSRNAPLDKFLAFKILRYNLTTGDVSNLGVLPNQSTFTDSERSLATSSEKVSPGEAYKYVVYPLVRDPKTITENNLTLRDEVTKKEYKTNFVKSRHPLNLIHGSVVSNKFIENDSKEDMLYGMVGTSFEVDVTTHSITPTVSDFVVGYYDRKKVLLNWNVGGDINIIDHFIIMKEMNGNRTIIGKSHCLEDNLKFFYELTKNDIGNIRFLLMPVYRDYLSGDAIFSNYILIDNVI